jgi:hypothetical protein
MLTKFNNYLNSMLNESKKKWKTKCGGKTVSHGHKDYTIAPGTCKGVRYCTRSAGIKDKGKCSPNQLSRRKWKCNGKCSGGKCPRDCGYGKKK